MTANVNEIREADWSIKLGAPGEVVTGAEDVRQCLDIVWQTPKGTVPGMPEFGCDALDYLDMPINDAIPNIKRAIYEAATRWDPRAKILGLAHQVDESNLQFTVTWEYQGTNAETSLTYALS